MDIFYRKYRLLKDTPSTEEGTHLVWDIWREFYTSKWQSSGIDYTEEIFTKNKVENSPEWFAPYGKPEPFYDKFPDDLSEHFYFGELRHNKMCRFCTVAQSVIDSGEFKDGVTEVFKKLYNPLITNA